MSCHDVAAMLNSLGSFLGSRQVTFSLFLYEWKVLLLWSNHIVPLNKATLPCSVLPPLSWPLLYISVTVIPGGFVYFSHQTARSVNTGSLLSSTAIWHATLKLSGLEHQLTISQNSMIYQFLCRFPKTLSLWLPSDREQTELHCLRHASRVHLGFHDPVTCPSCLPAS